MKIYLIYIYSNKKTSVMCVAAITNIKYNAIKIRIHIPAPSIRANPPEEDLTELSAL